MSNLLPLLHRLLLIFLIYFLHVWIFSFSWWVLILVLIFIVVSIFTFLWMLPIQ